MTTTLAAWNALSVKLKSERSFFFNRSLDQAEFDCETVSGFSSFSGEGAKLIGMSSRDSSVLYERRLVHRLYGHEGAVLYCAVDPKEKILATCSVDGKINLWTIATGENLRTLTGGHTGEVTSCAFSSIGSILASSSKDKKVILWHHDTGKRASRLGKDLKVSSLLQNIFFNMDTLH